MIWVQAAPESRAEGTASSVAPTGEEVLCPGQKSCVRTRTVSGLGWGHLSCLLGKLEHPRGLSSIMASGQYLTEFSCHLLSWGWSWEPRPRQESQDS